MFKRKKEQPAVAPDDLSRLAYDELLSRRNEIEAEIAARGTAELDALKAKLTAIATAQGLSLADLFASRRKPRRAAAPRYRNPDNPSETWSGRGKPPRWLQERIEAGAQKDDFRSPN